ncbi:N5-glutamine methyltransferase family protein [Plantactinospora soyae]|uniref:N5-glutamine methyltransferase family protein n=1 Tax=Plantactinospora soyae TaxID=1544732 RepID=UPI00384F23C0
MAATFAATELARSGVGPARTEAELLVAYVLGVRRGELALADPLTPGQLARLRDLVDRRSRHEPLQHLLGTAAFRHLELAVGPGVFVPRPETELLAGWGIVQARRVGRVEPGGGDLAGETGPVAPVADARPGPVPAPDDRSGPPPDDRSGPASAPDARLGPAVAGIGQRRTAIVVDLCSGTGAIALSVADEVPGARVFAVERAAAALAWLRRNADEQAGAGSPPIEVVAGDVADPGLLDDLAGRVDVLLCNPPYVPDGTVVPPEVAGHDPADAVFGGPDGLAVIRLVLDRAARLLRPGGALGIEHDDTHGTVVPDLLRADGRFVDVADHPDLVGRPRFATAHRAGATP